MMPNTGTLSEQSDALIARMKEILSDPEHPLMAAAIGIIKDGELLFADTVGNRNLSGEPANADTKFRIASISKLNTAIAVWQLIEQGSLDPDADVSGYLGFPLRNPHYPHIPITVRMLLSHTSSIRDGGKPGSYNIPYGQPISAFFTEGSAWHMPNCWAPAAEAPGVFFAYCNMNYCLLGTVIENVSGERFDRYMTKHIYGPMGLSCSFNVAAMPKDVQSRVGTLYRKLNSQGEYDPVHGIWEHQYDDFRDGYPVEDYRDYVIGSNGSLFGPMGSLRVSVLELCRIMQMFCNGGSYNGVPILKPETVDAMFAPAWTYDPDSHNGDNYGGLMNCYGMGPHIFTNQTMGDKLVADRDLPFAGHTAEAYGLVGGMGFDREKGNGIVYFVAGLGSNPAQYHGRYSAFYGFEEALLTAAADYARFPY